MALIDCFLKIIQPKMGQDGRVLPVHQECTRYNPVIVISTVQADFKNIHNEISNIQQAKADKTPPNWSTIIF